MLPQGSPAFLHSLLLAPKLRERFDAQLGGADGLFAEIVARLLVPQPSLLAEAASWYRKFVPRHSGEQASLPAHTREASAGGRRHAAAAH